MASGASSIKEADVQIHTQTVILMISMIYLVMHAAVWFALSEHRNAQVRLWSMSGLLSGMAVVLLSMRGNVSEFAFVYLGQVLMVLGNAGRCLALRMFFDQVSRTARWFYGVTSVVIPAVIIGGFEAGVTEYLLEIIYFGFYAIVLIDYFLMGYWLKGDRRSLGCDLLMIAGLGLSLTQAFRAVGVAINPAAQGIYAQTIDQYVMVAGQIIFIPLANIGFLRLFLQAREGKRLQAERELAVAEARRFLLSRHQAELQHLLREREEIIRQLTLSNKTAAMGALVASLAHELNQPLCSIRLNAQLVEKKLVDRSEPPDEVLALVRSLKSENRRAADIIVKLRKLFEDRSGATGELDFHEVIRDCVALVTPAATSQGVILHVQLDGEGRLVGDQTQLQQVVLNLLNNAIEATVMTGRADKLVRVTTRREAGYLLLSVEDNGAGIPPETQESLFQLFRSTKDDGMGVGLWLSKTVVNAHRGDITFFSEPGQGTCFKVRLPLDVP